MSSSVHRWPDRDTVLAAVRQWANAEVDAHPHLLRLGVFGSYARGDWGVGSDLDLIAFLETSDVPFESRSLSWSLLRLPVPAELLAYTREEWERMRARGDRFVGTIEREALWIYPPAA